MMFPEIEYQPLSVVKRFQELRLSLAMGIASTFSPFYRRMFDKHGIDFKKIKHIEDLQQIPFTDKNDLQNYNEDFLCVPRKKIIDYVTTSGTLGDPVTIAMTDADLERLAYNERISFECAGIKTDDIIQLMMTVDKRFMAGIAYFLAARKLGAGIVRVGNGI
ncbi:MAG: phenylacetate--CoA ligase family protein, partial [Tannerella sp.]|nr:phenylacetate--CoA ligase family protein [Tannerella sp.]